MAVQNYPVILNAVMWVQVVFAMVFIGLRLYTRQFIIRSVGWDDVLMVINLATFIAYVACISVGVEYGVGRKYATVEPANYSKAIMWEAIGQVICIMGIAASKASVAIFLLRIVLLKWHKALLWFVILSTTALCTITSFLLFFQCRPVAFLWDQTIKGGVCWLNFTPVGLTMGAWSAAMDFVLALLPWHVILGLNMKRKEKLTVAFGLSLGVFAGICSIVRTYQLQTLSSKLEYVYDTVPMLLWSSTEVLVSILCACIPVLRPLYVQIKYGSKGDSTNQTYPLSSDYGNKYGHKGSKSHTLNDLSKGRSNRGGPTETEIINDNTSEESILRDQKDWRDDHALPIQSFGSNDRQIKRTDEITVTTAPV